MNYTSWVWLFSYMNVNSFTALHWCGMIRWKKNALNKNKENFQRFAAEVGVWVKWWMCVVHAGSFCNSVSGLHPVFKMSNLVNVGRCVTSIHLSVKRRFLSNGRIFDFTSPTGHIHHQNKILSISIQAGILNSKVMYTNKCYWRKLL